MRADAGAPAMAVTEEPATEMGEEAAVAAVAETVLGIRMNGAQLLAIKEALSKPFATIQGPPGDTEVRWGEVEGGSAG